MNVPGLLPVVDGLLAAAKARGLTLVTRNTADLALSAALLNPWEGPRATGGRGR